jgi:hypothetical protein
MKWSGPLERSMPLNRNIGSWPARWNVRGREKLASQQQLEEVYHRFVQRQPRLLSATEREARRRLATDIPMFWSASTTTATDRKEIIRKAR